MENDDKSHSAYHLIRNLLIVHYESWFIRFQVLFDNKNVDQPRGGMGFPTLKTEKHGIVQKKKISRDQQILWKTKVQ